MNRTTKTIVFWLVVVISASLLWQVVKNQNPARSQESSEISYSQFLSDTESGKVTKVTISETRVQGAYRDGSAFEVNVPSNQDTMVDLLRKNNVQVWYANRNSNTTNWLMNLAPLALLALLWFFMIRQMQARNKRQTITPGSGSNAPWPST